MKQLVFASNNEHKLSEMRRIIGSRYRILSLADIGCHDDIPETADTLEGNALIKARWVKQKYGYDCFADDTGLMVDALDGAPGVYTARFAGEHCTPADNVALLLEKLRGNNQREARFSTVIALIMGEREMVMEGTVAGYIATEERGTDGFGYDPIFIPEETGLTFAQMGPDAKNAISHRGRAAARLLATLNELEKSDRSIPPPPPREAAGPPPLPGIKRPLPPPPPVAEAVWTASTDAPEAKAQVPADFKPGKVKDAPEDKPENKLFVAIGLVLLLISLAIFWIFRTENAYIAGSTIGAVGVALCSRGLPGSNRPGSVLSRCVPAAFTAAFITMIAGCLMVEEFRYVLISALGRAFWFVLAIVAIAGVACGLDWARKRFKSVSNKKC